MVGLGVPQLVTGLIMYWPILVGNGREALVTARVVHSAVAPYFGLFLVVQLLTGLLMWAAPIIIQKLRRKDQNEGEE